MPPLSGGLEGLGQAGDRSERKKSPLWDMFRCFQNQRVTGARLLCVNAFARLFLRVRMRCTLPGWRV
jgi:hypothetical protein